MTITSSECVSAKTEGLSGGSANCAAWYWLPEFMGAYLEKRVK